jgi:hypothetical protein
MPPEPNRQAEQQAEQRALTSSAFMDIAVAAGGLGGVVTMAANGPAAIQNTIDAAGAIKAKVRPTKDK